MPRFFILRFCALAAALFSLTACIATHSYVDPSRRILDEALRPAPAAPRPVAIVVTFQTNGEAKPKVASEIAPKFITDLTRSGHFRQNRPGESGDRLEITLNNVADIGSAVGKGLGTGLTMGLAGSRVKDGYVMTVHFMAADGREARKKYQHEIETTIGIKSAPEGKIQMSLNEAFDRVIDDLSRLLLHDLLQEGYFREAPLAAPAITALSSSPNPDSNPPNSPGL